MGRADPRAVISKLLSIRQSVALAGSVNRRLRSEFDSRRKSLSFCRRCAAQRARRLRRSCGPAYSVGLLVPPAELEDGGPAGEAARADGKHFNYHARFE